MVKAVYTYTVIDEPFGETILDHAKNTEVAERIGIKTSQIPDYVRNKWLFQKRYLICKNENEKAKERSWTAKERKFMKEWNEMRKAADLLRNGGHIVGKYVKGKYVKYVEAKR
jgi:hypothetical protein